jgi:methionine-rich copper-binding protein CopC
MKKLSISILGGLIAGGALLLPVSPALSHTAVQDSNPTDGSEVAEAPAEVWVKFGTLPIDQPIAVKDDARLEVFDACGARVDNDDSTLNMTQNVVTATTGGESAGRYELHWYAQGGIEGDPQSGVIDFTVTGGTPCKSVAREDVTKDVEFGFDVAEVSTKQAKKGATVLTIDLAQKATCASFGKTSLDTLQLGLDANANETDDFVGVFGCKRGGLTLSLSSGEAGAEAVVFPADLSAKGGSITASFKPSLFTDAEHLDVYALTLSENEGCTAEPAEGEVAPVCSDRAPDLGFLRAF